MSWRVEPGRAVDKGIKWIFHVRLSRITELIARRILEAERSAATDDDTITRPTDRPLMVDVKWLRRRELPEFQKAYI